MNAEIQNIVNEILVSKLDKNEIQQIIDAMKVKNYIVTAVLPHTPESETFGHFLTRFWNWENSPYLKEKRVVGQDIHRRYVEIMKSRVNNYWIPYLGKRELGTITRKDIKKRMQQLALFPQAVPIRKKDKNGKFLKKEMMLSAETINQIVRAALCPLKWAYHNGYTENNCFSGIIYCKVVPKKRQILSMQEANEIFKMHWENESYKLANLTAMCTGMRSGEIQALQLQDLGRDRIFVRHNWARTDGLKLPKNGSCREIKIPSELMFKLLRQSDKNPYGKEPTNFLFYGHTQNTPCQARHWNEALHSILQQAKIENWQDVTFHSWRHFFTARMADCVNQRKLCLVTGHKSLDILEHYAAHESEEILTELGNASSSLFLPIIKNATEYE